MDENTLNALHNIVDEAFKKSNNDRQKFLDLLTKGLKKLKADRVISGFDVEDGGDHFVLTVSDVEGGQHKFGIGV